ncbi:hypothetical protein HPP92_020728 [Vanilla planifolia]|uniref:Uncharacterized protein n=1 Tax=Vanilla planifolia TaxID=51239 RepID=A0A835Q6J5_VANPL|nr:hypothetical protein HPP92_020728 [Vanilla planifolia]
MYADDSSHDAAAWPVWEIVNRPPSLFLPGSIETRKAPAQKAGERLPIRVQPNQRNLPTPRRPPTVVSRIPPDQRHR